MQKFIRLFSLSLIVAWPFSGGSAEAPAEALSAIYEESCKAQSLPSAKPIYLALDKLLSDEAYKQPSYKRFDEIGQSVRNFAHEFLNSHLPKGCARPPIQAILALLDQDNPADNMLDAGRIYMERIQKIFKALGRQYTHESLKQDMEKLSNLFKSAYPVL